MSKILPQESREAELGCIGSILKSPEKVNGIFKFLDESDFYHPDLKVLFKICKELYESKTPIDQLLVHQKVVDLGLAKDIKSPDIIAVAIGFVPNEDNLGQYATVVKDKAARRELIEACKSVALNTSQASVDIDAVITSAKQIVSGIQFVSEARNTTNIKEESDKLIQTLNDIRAKGTPPKLITTGIPSLDKRIGGILPFELVVIGALPGMGKSTFGLNMLSHLCGGPDRLSCGLISLEMDKLTYTRRLYSHEASVPISRFNSVLNDEDMKRIESAKEYVDSWHLYINEESCMNLQGLLKNIETMHRLYKLKVVIIDYFQQIENDTKRETVTFLRDAAKAIFDLTRRLNLCIIALVQSNNRLLQDDRLPNFDCIEYAPRMGQLADKVGFLKWRGSQNEAGLAMLDLYLIKNRHGQSGPPIPLCFDGQYSIIKDCNK